MEARGDEAQRAKRVKAGCATTKYRRDFIEQPMSARPLWRDGEANMGGPCRRNALAVEARDIPEVVAGRLSQNSYNFIGK